MRVTGRDATGPARALAVLLVLAALAVSCGQDEPSLTKVPVGSEAVTFDSADGVALEGRLFGRGAVGVVLSHMRPSDQTSWWDFAQDLVDEGYLVLTYDFRGYCPGAVGGCSQGERDLGEIWRDVVGAVDFIRSRGATQVALIGASMGGTASLVAAAEDGVDADVVVTLSAPASFEGMDLTPEVLTKVMAAKLFIAGNGDGSAPDDAQTLYASSPPPKRVEILTTDDHGTDILDGNQSGRARNLILTYLEQYLGA
ncbi:MAG TPA: alpha/beta fold hydrolase [Actinomycetota bacterium]|nr:alpha/beta fold hydrolase [Actinomycetota bacterium]